MENKCYGDTSCNWYTWNGAKGLGRKTGGTGIQRKNGNHRDYSIVKIDQNTQKSPGDPRNLAITNVDLNINNDIKKSKNILLAHDLHS